MILKQLICIKITLFTFKTFYMSKKSRNQNFHQGRKDKHEGKQNPPGTGVGKLGAAAIGFGIAGPVGAIFGALIGDDKETRKERDAYKRGNKKK